MCRRRILRLPLLLQLLRVERTKSPLPNLSFLFFDILLFCSVQKALGRALGATTVALHFCFCTLCNAVDAIADLSSILFCLFLFLTNLRFIFMGAWSTLWAWFHYRPRLFLSMTIWVFSSVRLRAFRAGGQDNHDQVLIGDDEKGVGGVRRREASHFFC